ncbi:MAG: hypothetical protein ABJO36_03570 [Litorimonas sp.]
MKLHTLFLAISIAVGSLFISNIASANSCARTFHDRIDPTHEYEYTRSAKDLHKYGTLYWAEYGLSAALENREATLGLYFCFKNETCWGAFTVDDKKRVTKDLEKLAKALSKRDTKKTKKYRDRVWDSLPEDFPPPSLANYKSLHTTCGMSKKLIATAFEYELSVSSPEIQARQARCERAMQNLLEISKTNHDSIPFKESLWAAGYSFDKQEGKFCEEPSEAVLNKTFTKVDPYSSMPLDMDRPEHFRRFSAALDFSATQPLQSECEASFQGGTVMLTLSPLAKPKADESAWMSHYNSVRDAGGICNPIPKRLAEWGEDYVWQNGWPFAYDAATAKLDTCMEAVRVVANDGLGGEFARWVQGYSMRIDYPETRRPSGDICQGIPKPLQADLFPRMEAAREIRRQEAAERQRQLDLDYANAPPPPPSFGEIVRQWQKDWQARPVIVERCYTNQFDRYVCYDKTYR